MNDPIKITTLSLGNLSVENCLVNVLCEFSSDAQRQRALFFLREDTRPDFEDEIQKSELEMFHAIDEMPYPDEVSLIGDSGLYFEYESDIDEPVISCNLLGSISSLSVAKSEDDGSDYSIIVTSNSRGPSIIYATIDYDNEILDEKVSCFQDQLDQLEGMDLMLYLQEYLNKYEKFPYRLK